MALADKHHSMAEGMVVLWTERNQGELPKLSQTEMLLAGVIAPLPLLFGLSLPFGFLYFLLGHPLIAVASTLTAILADWVAQTLYRHWRAEFAEQPDRSIAGRVLTVMVARSVIAVWGPLAAYVVSPGQAELAALTIMVGLLLSSATGQGSMSRRAFWASAGPVLLAIAIAFGVGFETRTAVILLGGLALLAMFLSVLAGSAMRVLGDWTAVRSLNDELIARLRAEREEADQAREEARRAGEAKAAFLATMSHEIRTPMNGVLGMAQMLRRSVTTSEQRAQVDTLIHSGEFLLSILNDILDISKIDAGKLELSEQPEDPRALLSHLVDLWRPTAEARGLTLTLEIADGLPSALRMDAQRVRQILFNLIGNALKFTETGGVGVKVTAEPAGVHGVLLCIAVHDTGIGIAPDALARLFERFSQADQSTARRFGGAGLGLAISRQFCDLMGGVISAESTPGKGSTFMVELPLAIAHQAPDAPEPIAQSAPAATGLCLLVVDDNDVNLTVLKQILGALGHDVVCARSGAEALEIAARRAVDMVLLDIQMPGMSGPETLRRLRAIEGPNRTAPVVAVTADVLSHDKAGYGALGFQGYVAKPIQVPALAAALSAALATAVSEAA
jgi:signal transduction histidine kinase/ActR/RegA family two-component response regulator